MPWSKEELAAIIAQDIQDGWLVNLGIGMPTMVIGHLFDRDVLVHSENGVIGIGPPPPAGEEDMDLVNPGKEYATLIPGGAFIDSVVSFTLMRGGRMDLAVMGAYQVSVTGDLANWRLPEGRLAGIGGSADLAVGARNLWIMMTYRAPDGRPKIMSECSYPLTARSVVDRAYTDHGIFEFGADGYRLVKSAPGVEGSQIEDELAGGP